MTENQLEKFRQKLINSKVHLRAALKEYFCVDSEVLYKHAINQRSLRCKVVEHGFDGDIKIEVIETGRLIWVRGGMDDRLVRA